MFQCLKESNCKDTNLNTNKEKKRSMRKLVGSVIWITVLLFSCENESMSVEDNDVEDRMIMNDEENVLLTRTGTLMETSGYVCEGDFSLVETATGVDLILEDNFRADRALPGYGMFLTNHPNSIEDAFLVDSYRQENRRHYEGATTFSLQGVEIEEYQFLVHWCVPFDIQIGLSEIN